MLNFLLICKYTVHIYIMLIMKYMINNKQLTCINIIIKTLQEAINRECFSEEEIAKIIKTVDILCEK
jgi:hypothetical protein